MYDKEMTCASLPITFLVLRAGNFVVQNGFICLFLTLLHTHKKVAVDPYEVDLLE
ncbi:hypothetical protein J2T56_002059 [Natronobacillus azotifigens]|uniref:Uncharacterized protein n=1 Tax=Natronobacillus azotifigens TaxID=472978 RepID=A0A9J6REM1_9BACI|nr:hypothetical protein [Natronobacillus azotifigens]MCZ0703838.1 hypothetical protein [Natronobacillus azotifigens]